MAWVNEFFLWTDCSTSPHLLLHPSLVHLVQTKFSAHLTQRGKLYTITNPKVTLFLQLSFPKGQQMKVAPSVPVVGVWESGSLQLLC